MAQPYIGEIRIFAGNFAPVGWAMCDGQQVPISENEALFILIGTTYGGDGAETFNLPNLQSRIPIHQGNGPTGVTYTMGEMAGVEQVALTTQQIPVHSHAPLGQTEAGNQPDLTAAAWAFSNLVQFTNGDPVTPMAANLIQPAGGSQPHDNLMPYLCVNFIISLFGIFPQQS